MNKLEKNIKINDNKNNEKKNNNKKKPYKEEILERCLPSYLEND